VAAGVILLTNWTPIDPILSVFVALIVLKSAWGIVRSSAHILLEGTPEGLSLADIKADLEANVAEVRDAHHIHAWSITAEQHLLTLHVHPTQGTAARDVVTAVQSRLAERFNVAHVTVQVEEDICIDTHSHDQAGAGSSNCH
jgi:cobalt-zinc-cadmium efflux system protein